MCVCVCVCVILRGAWSTSGTGTILKQGKGNLLSSRGKYNLVDLRFFSFPAALLAFCRAKTLQFKLKVYPTRLSCMIST